MKGSTASVSVVAIAKHPTAHHVSLPRLRVVGLEDSLARLDRVVFVSITLHGYLNRLLT